MNYICTSCGEPCDPMIIDLGIGSYEYWGAPGIDVQLTVVSQCCEAAIIDESSTHVTIDSLPATTPFD